METIGIIFAVITTGFALWRTLDRTITQRLDGVEKRLDAVEKRIDKRLDGVDKRLDGLSGQVGDLRERMAKLEGAFDGFLAGRRDRDASA